MIRLRSLSTLPLDKIDGLKNSGVISSGMIPKVDGAAHAIKEGVKRVHFINANQPHSLLGLKYLLILA